MHRVIAGCNAWAVVFLLVSFALTATGSASSVQVSLFAAVFALFAQCAIFAMFMGAHWLLKEHIELYTLPESYLERSKTTMVPLFRWATVGSMAVLLQGVLAGLTASGEVTTTAQIAVGLFVIVVLGVAVSREVPLLAKMHTLLADMETALPAERPAPPPGTDGSYQGVGTPNSRARALFYVGSTVLAMELGYRYIAGLDVPVFVFWTGIIAAVICIIASAIVARQDEKAWLAEQELAATDADDRAAKP